MNKLRIILFIIILSVSHSYNAFAQDSLAIIMSEYLVRIKEIDSVIYTIKIKSNRKEIITNFYVKKLLSLKLQNNKQFAFYKFGSYTEDISPHFALIKNKDLANIHFIDCVNVENGIITLICDMYIKDIKSQELEAFKIKVLKYYINSFPSYPAYP